MTLSSLTAANPGKPSFKASVAHGKDLADALRISGFWHGKGKVNRQLWSFFNEAQFATFARYWEHLLLDTHMRDGGTYRFRRYSQLHYDNESHALTLLAHEAYEQPAYINSLNGGFKRHFEPIEETFLEHPFFMGLIHWLGAAYTKASEHAAWNIKLHPYRIIAGEAEGEPSPEGLHRDGVDFICSMLVRRSNVTGGETKITDNNRKTLATFTMNDPCDIMIGADARVMHGVSAVARKDPRKPTAYRDVLVIAFTKR
ncbi:MAG: 2OG-Fe dioxygenase family protein [Magnetovibrionaceae bacterium]